MKSAPFGADVEDGQDIGDEDDIVHVFIDVDAAENYGEYFVS